MVATQAASTKGVQNFYKVEFHFSIYPISRYILDFVTPCLKFRLQLATEKGFIIHKSFGPIAQLSFSLERGGQKSKMVILTSFLGQMAWVGPN